MRKILDGVIVICECLMPFCFFFWLCGKLVVQLTTFITIVLEWLLNPEILGIIFVSALIIFIIANVLKIFFKDN